MPASDHVAFRTAVAQDAATIAGLINAACNGDESLAGWTHESDLLTGSRTDEAEVLGLISAPDSVLLLCLVDAAIVGSVLVQRQSGTAAYLGMFVVRPQRQGAGLGKRLMQAAEDFVRREWGVRRMTMTAITLRPELIGFYGRRRYLPTGEILPFPPEAAARARVEGIELAVLAKELPATPGADGPRA